MEHSTTAPQQTGTQFDLAAHISDKFIEKLKNGIVPWHVSTITAGLPVNLVTKEPYRGINALLLLMAGFEQNLFLTFDQVNALGGKVKSKSKGHTVLKWEKPKAETAQKEPGDAQKLFMKQYTVFNIEQCEIPESAMPALAKPQSPLKAELVVKCMPKCPKIEYQNREVNYDVVEDTIYIPKLKSKKNEDIHYIPLLHLLVHSTGHDSRLARQGVAEMGELIDRPLYSKEELVAAIGSCFLYVRTGITHGYSSDVAYAQGWLEALQANKWLIFNATREAQKAFDYILDIKDSRKND